MNPSARRRKTVAMTSLSAFLACTLALALLLFVAGPASAKSKPKKSAKAAAKAAKAASDNYDVINAAVNAATDHEIVGSTAFPNYTTGAVDNYYSWAHSHVDNSPFAEGTSSPVDTGPIGQTAAAGNFAQPQYADARWPGGKDDSGKATFGNQGGPYATATAAEYDATATCTEASSGATGSSGSTSSRGVAAPKGFNKRLRLALAAWKGRWLVPLHLKSRGAARTPADATPTLPVTTTPLPVTTTLPTVTVPVPVPTVTTPGKTKSGSGSSSSSGNAGALFESSSVAALDPASGALVTSGESSLGNVNIGGQIVIRGIDVSASITNDGKPTDKVAIDIGAATIGGVPVTIDQDGVHVQGQGQNLPYQQADDALNSALKQAGVQLFTVQPEVVKADNQLTVTATGLHVKFVQPVDQPGVPAQFVEHILGEVFVDSLATPAGPAPKLDLNLNLGSSGSSSVPGAGTSSGGSSTGFGGTGGTSSSSPSSTYSSSSSSQPTSGSTGSSTQTAPASFLSTVRSKPLWLLVAFLVWQALAIGTGASLWRWRIGGAS